ncbi:MAG: hypothetical protein LUG62_06000 [Clostridiales bacterium]|nr:hypothetical protein [Clostridiales bacterium]
MSIPYLIFIAAALIIISLLALMPGRRIPFAHPLAQWATPIALLLTQAALLFWRRTMLPSSGQFLLTLVLAGSGGALAILCAFFPVGSVSCPSLCWV